VRMRVDGTFSKLLRLAECCIRDSEPVGSAATGLNQLLCYSRRLHSIEAKGLQRKEPTL
jgi:hypothetical protein